VSILAMDAEGLQAGTAALLALAVSPPASAPTPPALPEPDYAKLVAAKPLAASPAPFSKRWIGEDAITALDYDPGSGRVLAGTRGYGENLFCLDGTGRLLWKIYLPEHEVHAARWYDNGKRAVAATARGWWVFILAGDTGKVLRKFRGVEWPEMHYTEGAVRTPFRLQINPALRQILIDGRSGLLAVDYDGNRLWFHDIAPEAVTIPQTAEQSGQAQSFPISARLGDFALSPDGKRVGLGVYRIMGSAQVPGALRLGDAWAFRPRLLNAEDGALLLENSECPADQFSPSGWSMRWPENAKMPWLDKAGLSLPLTEDGKLGSPVLRQGLALPEGDSIECGLYTVVRRRALGGWQWQVETDRPFDPSRDCLDLAKGRLYRSAWNGWALCLDLDSGKIQWEKRLPWQCAFLPGGDRLFAGCGDGSVCCLSASGEVLWQTRLPDLHEPPAGDFAAYVRAAEARDAEVTVEHFAVSEDRPGDYDQILRFGMEQLQNGDFEQDDGWQSEGRQLTFASPGKDSQRCLRLAAGEAAVQTVGHRLVPLGTYLLEFFYRAEKA
ncbi:MAG: PQQ-binding-like beta-propeller repeat protein, partial [Planctomycetota bacterium]|nr:PQQ-binding-like beta-propeller repeat protein [Planctomycetota bacterium]